MKHGTNYSYKKKGCRCPECRAWNAANGRRYRKSRMERTGEVILQGRFYPGREAYADSKSRNYAEDRILRVPKPRMPDQ